MTLSDFTDREVMLRVGKKKRHRLAGLPAPIIDPGGEGVAFATRVAL